LPSEKELDNPEIKDYMAKYLKAAAPADKRMRIMKFLQNWVAGLHGVGQWKRLRKKLSHSRTIS
jgi:4-hydroxybutyryl-CoA dehydratase/vinylacetyl-CoA-Delta-isomerase